MMWEAGGEKPFSRCFMTRQAMGLFRLEDDSERRSGDGDLRQRSSLGGVQLRQGTPQWEVGMVGHDAATAAAAACE